jgi:hypothetical protein
MINTYHWQPSISFTFSENSFMILLDFTLATLFHMQRILFFIATGGCFQLYIQTIFVFSLLR